MFALEDLRPGPCVSKSKRRSEGSVPKIVPKMRENILRATIPLLGLAHPSKPEYLAFCNAEPRTHGRQSVDTSDLHSE
jgi:hypothetical protein